MTNKKITFCIEGEETELWDEYIHGKLAKDIQIQNRKNRKITGANTLFTSSQTLRQQTYRDGFKPLESGFGSESEDCDSSEDEVGDISSEEDLMMYEFDNKITQDIWLPQEPRLFVLYIGDKFISYTE